MKKHKRIDVCTVNNGYELKIEGCRSEFLYLSEQELVEGIIMHVTNGTKTEIEKEEAHNLVALIKNWKEVGDAVKEIRRLEKELEAMTRNRNAIARKVVKERQRMKSVLGDIEIAVQNESVKSLRNTLKMMRRLETIKLSDLGVSSNMIASDDDVEKM